MRVIRMQINAPDSFKEVFKEFAGEMEFDFCEGDGAGRAGDRSMLLWNAGELPDADYRVSIGEDGMHMQGKYLTKDAAIQDPGAVKQVLKRFVLDEESAAYIQKTQNQIGGKFRKMKRMYRMEGMLSHNVILMEHPKENVVKIGKGRMRRAKITIYGTGNTLIIEDGFNINHLELLIRGSHNVVHIGKCFELNYNTDHGPLYLSAKDDRNTIRLGNNIHVRGSAEIVCMEGTSLVIGDNFGMSNETIIRTGDGHRILDRDGTRSNPSRSIKIGNDCWLARRGVILKGVELKDYTIVGTAALVTKKYDHGNIVLGGNPAKIIKENVTWLPGR